jgi:YbbR domain-containing protein
VIETEWISKKDAVVGLVDGADVKSLKVKIDEKISTEAKEYTAKWQDLTGVYMPESEEVKVRARALPIVSKELTVPVEVIFDDNQKYIVDEKVTLKVKGAEEYIDEKNIKAKVNIKGLTPGGHNVKVEIETEKESLKISDKSVWVEIQ